MKIFALVNDLDYMPRTVEVSASWVEVTHTTGSGLGISLAANLLGSKFAASLGSTNSGSALSITGVAGSPTLIKRQVKTVVTIGDGEVLLIGGLNDNQSTKSTSGWSFLPASWASKSDSGVQTDLVLVLSAKLANQVAQN